MAYISKEFVEYQRKRWMRPDAHRWVRPDAHRWVHPDLKRYWGVDVADFFPTLAEQKANFNPNQPRLPAGVPEGGRWTDSGGTGRHVDSNRVGEDRAGERGPRPAQLSASSILEQARKIAVSSQATYRTCVNLCFPLLERFQRPGSDRNLWDFQKCLNACLAKSR